jgi:hypothetical protein
VQEEEGDQRQQEVSESTGRGEGQTEKKEEGE